MLLNSIFITNNEQKRDNQNYRLGRQGGRIVLEDIRSKPCGKIHESLLISHFFVYHIRHASFCPERQPLSVRDEVSVFSFYCQVVFNIPVGDDEDRAGSRKVLCLLQRVDAGLQYSAAAACDFDPSCDVFRGHVSCIRGFRAAEDDPYKGNVLGKGIAGNCSERQTDLGGEHGTGGIDHDAEGPVPQLFFPNIRGGALTTAGTRVGSVLFQQRKLFVKPSAEQDFLGNRRHGKGADLFDKAGGEISAGLDHVVIQSFTERVP